MTASSSEDVGMPGATVPFSLKPILLELEGGRRSVSVGNGDDGNLKGRNGEVFSGGGGGNGCDGDGGKSGGAVRGGGGGGGGGSGTNARV